MNRAPRIRLTPDQLDALLAGRPVEGVRHSGSLPQRGESYPVTMVDEQHLEVGAMVVGSRSRTRPDGRKAEKAWDLTLVLDSSDAPMLLHAESGGGVITPLPESRDADDPEAHGYSDTPTATTLDAGEAIPHEEVRTFAESKEAARRYAERHVDDLAKKRARSLGVQTRDVLMQARAHGIEVSDQVQAIEGALDELKAALRKAA